MPQFDFYTFCDFTFAGYGILFAMLLAEYYGFTLEVWVTSFTPSSVGTFIKQIPTCVTFVEFTMYAQKVLVKFSASLCFPKLLGDTPN